MSICGEKDIFLESVFLLVGSIVSLNKIKSYVIKNADSILSRESALLNKTIVYFYLGKSFIFTINKATTPIPDLSLRQLLLQSHRCWRLLRSQRMNLLYHTQRKSHGY